MLETINLKKHFLNQGLWVKALDDVSFKVSEGSSTAICGTSGAGKSTLLNLIGGLDRPTSGQVIIHDQDVTGMNEQTESQFRNQKLGFVFQFHHLLHDFTILENVMMPLLIQKVDKKEACDRAVKLLQQVDIEDKKKRYPQELSGGEQQRAAIARALVHHPKLILADEPTGNLDEKNGDIVFELLCQLNHDLGATLIVVTHNTKYSKKLNHILTLEAGKILDFH